MYDFLIAGFDEVVLVDVVAAFVSCFSTGAEVATVAFDDADREVDRDGLFTVDFAGAAFAEEAVVFFVVLARVAMCIIIN